MAFHDHFSGHAADYAKFRPRYPASLFSDLAALCAERDSAWDCATGNGQAAVALAAHFRQVMATDASPQQIEQAEAHRGVTYRVGAEGDSGLPDYSTDLITVAQALHWFHLPTFYAEAHRVLKPCGLLAIWCYGLQRLGEPFDIVLSHFYAQTVGPYWPLERRLVEEGYRTLDFPFDELPPPVASMQQELSLDGLLNYLGSWSAVKRFEQDRGEGPIPALERELLPLWGERDQPRRVTWPLSIRVGRNRE